MGYKLLSILITATFLCANSYPDIDRLVEKVKLQRVGLSPQEIKILKDPFISEKKIKKVIKTHRANYKIKKRKNFLRLFALFNNRAKINHKWYKVGERIGLYRLVKVDPKRRYVLLQYKNKTITLFYKKRKNRKIKLITISGRKK